MNLIMHKIVNILCDCGEIGFELDNGEVIYQFNGEWLENEYHQAHYNPVIDDDSNLIGFIIPEIKED